MHSKGQQTIIVYNYSYLQTRWVNRITQVSSHEYDWEPSDIRCMIRSSNDGHEHILIPIQLRTEQISAYRESGKWNPKALYYHQCKSLKMLTSVDSDAMHLQPRYQLNRKYSKHGINLEYLTNNSRYLSRCRKSNVCNFLGLKHPLFLFKKNACRSTLAPHSQ